MFEVCPAGFLKTNKNKSYTKVEMCKHFEYLSPSTFTTLTSLSWVDVGASVHESLCSSSELCFHLDGELDFIAKSVNINLVPRVIYAGVSMPPLP